ncbi:hypothetical protein BJF82_14105 [Kytococcus sp. CUA-901]|nr:hypothetical protein BJF82_14105 [Kytococcus sp. CUA-901]
MHLTEWELRRTGTLVPEPGILVLVCENPRVLEAVAQDGIPGWAVVCTSGEPNLVVDRLLVDLAAAGVELRYHGDLDWPGVAIANRAMMRYRARPWLMSAQDYLAGVSRSASGPALSGGEVEPGWDPDLGAAMRSHGRGVHEEASSTPCCRLCATTVRDVVMPQVGAGRAQTNGAGQLSGNRVFATMNSSFVRAPRRWPVARR